MRRLQDLLKGVEILSLSGSLDIPVTGIKIDSRKIEKGNCFVAVKGFNTDGIRFLDQAVKNGATSVISENPPDPQGQKITWVQVKKKYGGTKIPFYMKHVLPEKKYDKIKERYEKKLTPRYRKQLSWVLLDFAPRCTMDEQ